MGLSDIAKAPVSHGVEPHDLETGPDLRVPRQPMARSPRSSLLPRERFSPRADCGFRPDPSASNASLPCLLPPEAFGRVVAPSRRWPSFGHQNTASAGSGAENDSHRPFRCGLRRHLLFVAEGISAMASAARPRSVLHPGRGCHRGPDEGHAQSRRELQQRHPAARRAWIRANQPGPRRMAGATVTSKVRTSATRR